MSEPDMTEDSMTEETPSPAPQLLYEDFEPHVGSSFLMPFEDGQDLELELVEAIPMEHLPKTERTAFSLIFRGPQEPCLGQHTYHLRHDSLGPLVLFLVPVQSDEVGSEYEAVFT